MQSSKELNPLTKIVARKMARSIWKDYLQNTDFKNSLTNNLNRFVASLKPNSRLLAYIALPEEVDIISILEKFSLQVYVPAFDDAGNMDFALYMESGVKKATLCRGPFGIWMPEQKEMMLKLPLDESDIVFVPSLASNENGTRLGRGGGYYDRWKSRLNKSKIVGILPSVLSALNFLAENHDIKLHRVITENGIVDYN